nr:malate synthase A [Actinokineospora xionganensis]
MTDIRINGAPVERGDEILTPAALDFVADLQRRFGGTRDALVAARAERRTEVARTGRLDFLDATRDIRESDWTVAAAPEDLTDRRVEITGPAEAKMAINALNSGARVWLADLEDASTPHWANVVSAQVTLADAVRKKLTYSAPDGTAYRLREDARLATIVMRPRGWHLPERHVVVDGRPAVAALVDFGLYFFHNARELTGRGGGPYFYLPKLESHLEARLWNDVFIHAQDALGIPRGSVRATVLIETIPAAFEMDEILYELREHASGLNAGRWDYLFSVIKYFRDVGPDFVLPDRNGVGMTAPFMRAYTDLLVRTCHRRGAFAMGGMSAFIPSRRDPELTEVALAKVRADKEREAHGGFDGSWVAHPDLVPVCREVFDGVLGERPNQLDRTRDDVSVTAEQLLDVASTPGEPTAEGLRGNVAVALRYLEAWLRGSGAVAIFNLMEDAATAEIARSQIWQWLRNDVKLADSGELVTVDLVRRMEDEELASLRESLGAEHFEAGRFGDARALFERVALSDDFVDFLTLPAYDLID